MNAAEIVVREVQSDSGFQVRQLLAERIREPRKTPHRHSHSQILPLNKRSADMTGIGITLSDFGYNPRDSRRGVPRIGAIELSVIAKHFRELREVAIRPEAFGHRDRVVVKPIGGELDAVGNTVMQVPEECPSIGTHALADVKCGNQFAFCIDGNVNPLVTKFRRVSGTHVAPFLPDVAPNFIDLQIPGIEFTHSRVHQSGAAFASDKQEAHDRVAIQTCESFGAANRAAFKKAMQRTFCRIGIRGHHVSGEFRMGFAKGRRTGLAAPSLNAALTEVAELFASLVLAFGAGHVSFPLFLGGSTCYHEIASEVRVAPRFGLSGIHGSNRGYRVCIYYGGGISHLPSSLRAEGLCYRVPLPTSALFADFPAKSNTKSKRPPSRGTGNLSLLMQSLQDCIEEGQRILNSFEVVTPCNEYRPNFDRTQPLSRVLIHNCADKISPRYLGLYLLAKCILQSDFRGFQSGNLSVKQVALSFIRNNLRFYMLEGFLEFIRHGYSN
jgi:hypothetical protein